VKVVLDLRAGSWLGGRYYLQNLALALHSLPPDERPELVALTGGDDADDVAGVADAAAELPEDADIVFPNWELRGRTAAAQLHWIPDLQHRRLPGNFSRNERLKRNVAFVRFAVRARRVVVSSEVVRRQAARAYPPFARKLRVLHFTTVVPPAAVAADPCEILARYELPERFLLLPNQFWAHKNHEVAFAAMAQIDVPLICTGATEDRRRPEYFTRLLESLEAGGARDRVRILGVVPRGDYLQLVRAAAVVVQPSLFEGWSSVVEDARAFGKPIALSDIPVHREQDPAGARYFAPADPRQLAAAIADALAAPA
jgi:glycosyltransferase involved in cell wall biosynthesis